VTVAPLRVAGAFRPSLDLRTGDKQRGGKYRLERTRRTRVRAGQRRGFRMHWCRPATIAMLALVAGCSSAKDAGPTTSETTTVPSAITTTATLTTAQVASKVAEEAPKIRHYDAAFDAECNYATGICLPVGGIGAQGVGLAADTLATELQIGKTPSELDDLVMETISDADALHTAGDKILTTDHGCQNDATANACKADLLDLGIKLKAMVSRLDAWKPYGA
jgi:hypothetical protein